MPHSEIAHRSKRRHRSMTRGLAEAEILNLKNSVASQDWNKAKSISLTIVKKNPQFGFAWKVLGTVYQREGRITEAIKAKERAVNCDQNDARAHFNLGNSYRESKRFEDAIESFTKAVTIDPKYASAYRNLANSLRDTAQFSEAEKNYVAALTLEPNIASCHNNLGCVIQEQGRIEEACASFEEACRLDPNLLSARSNLARALIRLGLPHRAEDVIKEAPQFNSGSVELLTVLGLCLEAQGKHDEAERVLAESSRDSRASAETYLALGDIQYRARKYNDAIDSYKKAAEIEPNNVQALKNLSGIYRELGRLSDSEEIYQRTIDVNRQSFEVWFNFGNVQKDLGKFPEALHAYEKALEIKPRSFEALTNVGAVLHKIGKNPAAENFFRGAIFQNPKCWVAHNNLGNVLSAQGRVAEAERSFREALRLDPDYRSAYSNLLLSMQYSGCWSPQEAKSEAQSYGLHVSAAAQPKFTSWRSRAGGKLRVGFVSGDLRAHPVAYFLESVLVHLDRERFEWIAFSTNPQFDEYSSRLKARFDEWTVLVGLSDAEAAARIHESGIDILIDLAGHTAHNRLSIFSYRPAPVQATWLGYFSTTGVPEIDYFIGDHFMTPPEHESHFSERILRLPDTRICFTPPDDDLSIVESPAIKNGYITYGCFNNLAKISDDVLSLWARILNSIQDSKLFLKNKNLGDQQTCADLIARFNHYGISEDRLIFEGQSSRRDYLMRYNDIDIALDPFPFPGGTTTAEALWMGVPVITLRGDRCIGLQGVSMLHNVGYSEWVCSDKDEYATRAKALGCDVSYLSAVRQELRNQLRASPLCNAEKFSTEFEKILFGMSIR